MGKLNFEGLYVLGVKRWQTGEGINPFDAFHMKVACLCLTCSSNGKILCCLKSGGVCSYLLMVNDIKRIAFFTFFLMGSRMEVLVQDQLSKL